MQIIKKYCKKYIRAFHAVKYIPASRIYFRLKLRASRKLRDKYPRIWFNRIAAKGLEYKCQGIAKPLLVLAHLKANMENTTSCGIKVRGQSSFEVTIHNVSENACFSSHELRYDRRDKTALWKMTFSYLNHLLNPEFLNSEFKEDLLLNVARHYNSMSCWSFPDSQTIEWHCYSASHRLINLICLRCMFDGQLTVDCKQKVDESIGFHTAFVNKYVEYDLHYNHLSKNMMALCISELFWTEKISSNTVKKYIDVLEYQTLPDGMHAELCPMYHLLMIADCALILSLGKNVLQEEHIVKLTTIANSMVAATEVVCYDNGEPSLFGDSWLGEAPSLFLLRDQLSTNNVGRTEAAGIDGRGHTSKNFQLLESAGFAKLESSGIQVIFDVGAIGPLDAPGHGHDDVLSIEIYLSNNKWVSDYGVEAYTPGLPRDLTRSAVTHNGPRYEGALGMDAWHSYRVGRRSSKPKVKSGVLDIGWSYVSGVHRHISDVSSFVLRTVFVHEKYGVLVIDEWSDSLLNCHPLTEFRITAGLEQLSNHRGWIGSGLCVVSQSGKVHDVIGQSTDCLLFEIRPVRNFYALWLAPIGTDCESMGDDLVQDLRNGVT